jgi:hypothetical protein
MVADLLGELERDYPEAEVLDAMIAVEVQLEDSDTVIEHRCTSSRLTVATGIAHAAYTSITEPYGRGDD